jgi:tRNA (Thr-GGU) A37 N-methylase
MRNRSFHPPKCRGKLQKMGVLYTHSPKRPSPFFKLLKKIKKLKEKVQFDKARRKSTAGG